MWHDLKFSLLIQTTCQGYSHTQHLRFVLQHQMTHQLLVRAKGRKNIDTGAACWCQSANILFRMMGSVALWDGLSLNSIFERIYLLNHLLFFKIISTKIFFKQARSSSDGPILAHQDLVRFYSFSGNDTFLFKNNYRIITIIPFKTWYIFQRS